MCKLQCLISFSLYMHHVGVLLSGEENVSFHLAHVLPSQLSFFANIICKHWMPQMIKPVVNTPLQMIPNLQNCWIYSQRFPTLQPASFCPLLIIPPPPPPTITELVGVEGGMLDHPVCLSLQALSRRYLLVTILGMVVQHHEPGCHTKNLSCYL